MSLLESVSTHFDSIVFVWSGYLLSMLFFYLYNYKFKITYAGRKDAIAVKLVSFFNRTICILPVVLPITVRSMYTGADTYNYWQSFIKFQNYSFFDAITFDLTAVLYNVFRWAVVKLTHANVQVFFFLFAFATMYLVVLTIEKWNLKYGCTALFVFYCCFGLNLMNQMRQMFAVAILLYAYQYAYNKQFKKYFIWAVFAGLFHFSALLSAVVIWVLQKDKKNQFKEYLYYFVLCFSVFGMQYLFSFLNLLMNATKYGTMYLEESVVENTSVGLGLLLAIIPNVIPIIMFQKRLDKENRFRNTILLTLPARLAGYYSYYVYRIMYYFSIQSVVALPLILEKKSKNKKYIKAIIYFLCVSYFILFYVWKGSEIYFPYITIWEAH